METREWKTIKEYQDILFDFYNGIAKSPSTVRVTATHSPRLQPPKSVMPCITAVSAGIST